MTNKLEFLGKFTNTEILSVSFNLNDIFYFACSDGCAIDVCDLEDLTNIFNRYGFDTVIAYEAIRRGHDPKIPQVITETYKMAKQDIQKMLDTTDRYTLFDLKRYLKENAI